MNQDAKSHDSDAGSGDPRRGFFAQVASIVVGGFVGLVPLVSGLVVFFDPLGRRRSQGGKPLRVASLDAVPADGLPHRFPVIDTRWDKWSKYPPQPIGAVYLRRQSEDEPPQAVSAVCPHLGCAVDFKADQALYQCPCHNSSWTPDAVRVRPESCPSPRDLDELEVEIRNDNEVWVRYQRFRSGIAKKIPE